MDFFFSSPSIISIIYSKTFLLLEMEAFRNTHSKHSQNSFEIEWEKNASFMKWTQSDYVVEFKWMHHG